MNYEITSIDIFGKMISVTPWEIFGYMGVMLFTARWFVQIYYSHLEGKPVTPRVFWVLSVVGSLITLTYFLFRPSAKFETVGVLSNLFPSFIASYNLYLELSHRREKTPPLPQIEKLESAEKPEKPEKPVQRTSAPVAAAVND